MTTEFERILDVLRRHISPAHARALLLKALNEQQLSPDTLSRRELRTCSAALRRGIALFVAPSRREAALLEISAACESDSLRPDASAITVAVEGDLEVARAEARRVCGAVGARGFVLQKVATIVSELARNMVMYGGGGQLEIVPMSAAKKRIIIRATDQGPGIPNLEVILSGRYQSKTGLGRGLAGSKRLADGFEISTGSAGTRVVAEVVV
jgi:serine/threonine-protein kinase RsbT